LPVFPEDYPYAKLIESSAEATGMGGFQDVSEYRILLDSPTDQPAYGFKQYAEALANIILKSEPRFVVGVFGSWGSGKSTLMEAIRREVSTNPQVVTVDFNAWRYEREEHLIVPLLDTLREALAQWAEAGAKRDKENIARARNAARSMRRAAQAIIAGLTLKLRGAGFAGPEAALDFGKVLEKLQHEEGSPSEPQSFYHICFNSLKEVSEEFAGRDGQRIVVFIDDLDRCTASNSIQVLESMKLFFDLKGFVFVVGLDNSVIERLITAKYSKNGSSSIKGAEYIRKIFQMQFELPQVTSQRLEELMSDGQLNGLPKEQREEIRTRIRSHLETVVAESGINPRQVKRYINTYTLSRKAYPSLDPDTLLAVQTVLFRDDWEPARVGLLTHGDVFLDAVRRRIDGNRTAIENFWPELGAIPESFFVYAREHLREVNSIEPYVHGAEAEQLTPRALLEAYERIDSIIEIRQSSVHGHRRAGAAAADISRHLRELRHKLSLLSDHAATQRALDEVGRYEERRKNSTDAEWVKAGEVLTAALLAHFQNIRSSTRVSVM
jgi:ABC-type dipeptide/oligopeptide/nickel transport system ATPase component